MSENNLLIVGGGIAGMSLAIRMREQGWRVDLVEIDPEWRVYGAGISLTAPTYRAFKRLGVAQQVLAGGFGCEEGVRICLPSGQGVFDVPVMPIEPTPSRAGLEPAPATTVSLVVTPEAVLV